MHNGVWSTKKNSKGAYDPQVGEAAKANAAIADRSMQFSEQYFKDYVAPMLEEMTSSTHQAQQNENELYADNRADQQLARKRYQEYGIPAENKYYQMADEYSAPQEEQRQAGLALGDVRTAQAGQKATMQRSLAGMGIDPTSPAAIAAMGDMAVMGSAAEAGASTRARQAAKALGMQLTSDAANFGRGGQSAVLNFGQAASGNTTAGASVSGAGLSGANSGAGVVQNGYGLGLKGYGANLDAYTSLNNTSMQINAQANAGLGKFLGTAAGALMPSDRRLKKNIMRVGEFGEFNLPLYTFDYIWEPDGTGNTGVMAQDILPFIPEAVSHDAAGFYRVDYSRLR